MPIGLGVLMTDDLPQDIMPLWEETLSPGEVRNKVLSPGLVLKQNTGPWPTEWLKSYG